ncbi:hypothetical protein [Mycoplasma sp. OR1901]|uniref:hypothetical protein n=1 Tax=Mycoplasma sp. OR1901 TaxID=2742195 RepID=UPI00158409C3|nr:hypothetical protein [Mycoplasma sp. OR1901]QKT05189.1 hypothetical protein HTZ87_00445 [Mycoplasma sp. OR1901]
MASKVTAHCAKCNINYTYLFGESDQLILFNIFLDEYKKSQIELFDKEKFINYFKPIFLENIQEFKEFSEEKQLELLNDNYAKILNFFFPEEIELIKKNIVMNHNIEVFPIINTNLTETERSIISVPIMKIKFLTGEEYVRQYSNNVAYVQFTPDQQFLTCPVHLDLTAQFISEEKV